MPQQKRLKYEVPRLLPLTQDIFGQESPCGLGSGGGNPCSVGGNCCEGDTNTVDGGNACQEGAWLIVSNPGGCQMGNSFVPAVCFPTGYGVSD